MNEYGKQYSNFIRHVEHIIKHNDAFDVIKARDQEVNIIKNLADWGK